MFLYIHCKIFTYRVNPTFFENPLTIKQFNVTFTEQNRIFPVLIIFYDLKSHFTYPKTNVGQSIPAWLYLMSIVY